MKLEKVIEFAEEHGPPQCFHGWTREKTAAFLAHHALKGTLLVIEEDGRVRGLVTWTRVADGMDPQRVMEHTWDQDDPTSLRLYWSAIIGVGRDAFRALWEGFKIMVPDWQRFDYWAHRRGRLVKYPPRFTHHLERLPI